MIKYDELLPKESFAYLNTTGEIIKIKKGEKGYYTLNNSDEITQTVDELNELWDVTKPQAEAMLHGSMFGWDTTASNPQYWEEQAKEKGERVYTHNEKPEYSRP